MFVSTVPPPVFANKLPERLSRNLPSIHVEQTHIHLHLLVQDSSSNSSKVMVTAEHVDYVEDLAITPQLQLRLENQQSGLYHLPS